MEASAVMPTIRRRLPRLVVGNALAAATQLYLILSVLTYRDESPTRPSRNHAPHSLILFWVAGVFGGVISAISLLALYFVVVALGFQSTSFSTVARTVTACVYLGKLAQYLGYLGFLFYLEPFFNRITDGFDGNDGFNAVLQVAGVCVLVPLYPGLFVSTHGFLSHDVTAETAT